MAYMNIYTKKEKAVTPDHLSPKDFLARIQRLVEHGNQMEIRVEVSFSDGAPHPSELTKELWGQTFEMEVSHYDDEPEIHMMDWVLWAKFGYSNEDDTEGVLYPE
jgi:hypothetical protein